MAQAPVQMLFSPTDEKLFFEALRAGAFDAKAVCGAVDAMKATATVPDDKAMIAGKIKKGVGLASYNEQLRTFLEEQYTLAAVRGSTGSAGSGSTSSTVSRRGSGGGSEHFQELLKVRLNFVRRPALLLTRLSLHSRLVLQHMRRMHNKLEEVSTELRELKADRTHQMAGGGGHERRGADVNGP